MSMSGRYGGPLSPAGGGKAGSKGGGSDGAAVVSRQASDCAGSSSSDDEELPAPGPLNVLKEGETSADFFADMQRNMRAKEERAAAAAAATAAAEAETETVRERERERTAREARTMKRQEEAVNAKIEVADGGGGGDVGAGESAPSMEGGPAAAAADVGGGSGSEERDCPPEVAAAMAAALAAGGEGPPPARRRKPSLSSMAAQGGGRRGSRRGSGDFGVGGAGSGGGGGGGPAEAPRVMFAEQPEVFRPSYATFTPSLPGSGGDSGGGGGGEAAEWPDQADGGSSRRQTTDGKPALKYRPPSERNEQASTIAPPSSVARPNIDDALRRVSVVVYQHIGRGEQHRLHQEAGGGESMGGGAAGGMAPESPFGGGIGGSDIGGMGGGGGGAVRRSAMSSTSSSDGGGRRSAQNSAVGAGGAFGDGIGGARDRDSSITKGGLDRESERNSEAAAVAFAAQFAPDVSVFDEEQYVAPKFKYTFLRVPGALGLTSYGVQEVQRVFAVPTVDEVFAFCKHLFVKAQLSSECSIVCLVYVERLMEEAQVPLLASNWRPIVLCGLLLASKVWQDLSSWNVEFSTIFPQFTLVNINRLERTFLHHIHWDLYISGSVYAKYYFALRSMTEKKNFRRRYNYMMQVNAPGAKRLEERTVRVKNELYSRSL